MYLYQQCLLDFYTNFGNKVVRGKDAFGGFIPDGFHYCYQKQCLAKVDWRIANPAARGPEKLSNYWTVTDKGVYEVSQLKPDLVLEEDWARAAAFVLTR